jgi:hypothetical protein
MTNDCVKGWDRRGAFSSLIVLVPPLNHFRGRISLEKVLEMEKIAHLEEGDGVF